MVSSERKSEQLNGWWVVSLSVGAEAPKSATKELLETHHLVSITADLFQQVSDLTDGEVTPPGAVASFQVNPSIIGLLT